MQTKLPPGTVLGRRRRSGAAAGFLLTEACFPAHAVLPTHCHENAFFRLIVAGSSTDVARGRSFLGEAATMVYHAAGEQHANRWHRAGRSFVIELPADAAERIGTPARVLEQRGTFASGPAVETALRLFAEFRQPDAFTPLALEGLLLELLARAWRSAFSAEPKGPPTWLRRARDMLDECPAPLALSDVAAEAGVHPGHLARAFRAHFHCTPGEYVRRRRVERACRLLAGKTPLAGVAVEVGFADQSHFSAVFKRHLGVTPAVYRSNLHGR